jgi:hypothetical protein
MVSLIWSRTWVRIRPAKRTMPIKIEAGQISAGVNQSVIKDAIWVVGAIEQLVRFCLYGR